MSDERLAEEVARALGMSEESALRAVRSVDPDLGRSWAIGILRRESSHQAGQARLSEHLAGMRISI